MQNAAVNTPNEAQVDSANFGAQSVLSTSKVALAQAKKAQQQAQSKAARTYAYRQEADDLAFKYLAMQAQYGDCHSCTLAAKEQWLNARKAIQARYPKTHD